MKKSKLLIILGIIMCLLTFTVAADELDGVEGEYVEDSFMEEEFVEEITPEYQLKEEYIEETVEEEPTYRPIESQFDDVSGEDFFFDAVNWAVETGVTSGTSAKTFSPFDTCTRGQVVTFLWRAKGCPKPNMTNNIFTDVAADAYYNEAVLWAYENNITSGTTATTFSPDETCTSGQVITFVWRALDKPYADISSLPAYEQSQYYAQAVAWANDYSLLSNSSTAFAANNPSPRADIVTYLYYALN